MVNSSNQEEQYSKNSFNYSDAILNKQLYLAS